ncbi:response regulator [Cellvibrio sp. PSBB006]|uniref:response regulator n=1 Tax=Cellvibrio sp. PSBB006 TaxID=1987723 RepID=UPI000B3B869B|nr:response regulator [Cellvibrio sp. PSBB006]ARU26491.1 DNA-binding response regulator [Cellvibrio sp. PSBB006]
MSKILIIDDEPQIRRFLHIGLSAQGYQIIEAESGQQGLALAALEAPQLVILDLGLPDMDGQEVLLQLRDFYQQPVIVLSVRSRESEKVHALDNGANDYVVKPFGIQELLARMRSLLKLYGKQITPTAIYQDERVYINLQERKLVIQNEQVKLSRKEFDVLRMLMNHAGHIVTQQQLLKEIWGKSHVEDTHYLRIFIGRLRTKLGDDPSAPRYIETEPGVGYRFLPLMD